MATETRNILEQGLLKYLTPEQLNQIQSKKVGIGGAGGLGSNVAMILVRSGFCHLEILDFDVIDPSNLNRQQYFAGEVGLLKTEVLEKRLCDINPDLDIVAHNVKWSEESGEKFFQKCDFIVEAFDVADFKHRFVDFYHDKTAAMVSGVGMAGLTEKQPMRIRRIGNIYICGDTSTCSHQGHPPMAPRVTQCAALMSEVILDLTLNIPLQF